MPTDTAVQRYTPLEEVLLTCRKSLSTILGTPEKAGQLVVEVLNMARRTPDLARCEPSSLTFAVIRIASLRLNPSLPNEVFIIPRRLKRDAAWVWEATLQYGYGGLRKLIMRSPEVHDVFAREVRVNDTYQPPPTPVELPRHILPGGFAPRGRVIGYYAAVLLTCGNWRIWMMSVAEVEAHRNRSVPTDRDGAYGSAWQRNREDQEGLTNFDKMALKTCLRMLCNPRDFSLEAEVATAIAAEDVLLKETPAQLQGYTRGGQRLTPAAAVQDTPLEEHVEDLFGPTPDKRGGQSLRTAIEAMHRAAGKDEWEIVSYWGRICREKGVQAPEELPQVYSKEAMLPFITQAMSVKDSAQLRLETWKTQNEMARLGLQGEPAAMVSELRAMGVNPLQATPEQRQQAQKNIQQRELEQKEKEGLAGAQATAQANREAHQTQTLSEAFKGDTVNLYDTQTGRPLPARMKVADYEQMPQQRVTQLSDDNRKQMGNVNSAMPRLQILQQHVDAVYGPMSSGPRRCCRTSALPCRCGRRSCISPIRARPRFGR